MVKKDGDKGREIIFLPGEECIHIRIYETGKEAIG
jgi:hypothetical protein